jgi:hypothetical protein
MYNYLMIGLFRLCSLFGFLLWAAGGAPSGHYQYKLIVCPINTISLKENKFVIESIIIKIFLLVERLLRIFKKCSFCINTITKAIANNMIIKILVQSLYR